MPLTVFLHLTLFTGSMDGSAVLLSDEPIHVQDHNYFPTPAHLPEEVQSSAASSSSGGAGDAPGQVVGGGAAGSGNNAGIAAAGALSPPGGKGNL